MESSEKKTKRGKGKQKPIVVDKQSLLYQPWKLIKSGYDATAFQQNVIISVLKKLKSSLADMRDDYMAHPQAPRQLSLFETEGAVAFRREEEDAMTFSIHMKELGVEPQNYQRAFNAVCNISDIDVWIPVTNPEGGKEELERAKLFSIIINKEDAIVDENNQVVGFKYEKHNPTVKLKLRKNVAETLFQGQIHTFLEETAMNISEKFPKRLYMYFANFKNAGEVTIDYWKFRQQIGFEDHDPEKIQYPKFFDFRKRVLDPSVQKLREMAEMGQAEYWFEYEALYKGAGRAKYPDLLKFTIHLSQIGEDYEKQKESFKERRQVENRLSETFDQTTAQVRKLVSALSAEDYSAFNAKLDELERYFMNHRNEIKDRRSYANRVLTDFIADSKEFKKVQMDIERQKENLESAAKATSGEVLHESDDKMISPEPESKNINDSLHLMTPEEKKLIEQFILDLMREPDGKMLLEFICVAKNEKGFILYVPSLATYQTFQQRIDEVLSDLSDVLDEEINVRINS